MVGRTVQARKTPAVPGKRVAPKTPAPKPAQKAAVKAHLKAVARKPPAQKSERRLAGIRAATGELSKALEEMEKARQAIEGQFQKSAEANLSRARGALETLGKVAAAGPLLDARRLERDLASLVDSCGELKGRPTKGRKRDILAVDDLLGDAARRLELAVTGTAAANLRLLAERLVEMEAFRQDLQKTVRERFRTRLDSSKAVLASLEGAAVRLNEEQLDRISKELEGALALARASPPGKLEGKPKDLYGIDGFVKQVARRLGKVQELLAVRTEESDG